MTEPIPTPVKPPFWNNPQTRAIAFQVIALVVTVAFGWSIFENTQANLRRLGIASGFDFFNGQPRQILFGSPLSYLWSGLPSVSEQVASPGHASPCSLMQAN